jgi:hypothetical protein
MADARITQLEVLVGSAAHGDARVTQLNLLVGTKSLGDNRVTQLHLLVGAPYVQATATPVLAVAAVAVLRMEG